MYYNNVEEMLGADNVKEYVSLPTSLMEGISDDVFIAKADGGNHFTDYGIFEGTLMIFDAQKGFRQGRLSAYRKLGNGDGPELRISDKFIVGYEHLGRLVMTINNFEV
jgi:hypothetical protein